MKVKKTKEDIMRITKKTIFLIIFSSLIFPLLLFAQVLNGSFEIDGQPTLENWSFSCDLLGYSYNDAPSGVPDNNWCLKLESGNSQGCFPSYAYQIIPEIRDGDIWHATVWTKRQNSLSQPSLYWKIFRADGSETDLSVATTFSYYWDQISVEDTIHISEGDSVAIILDAGLVISYPQTNFTFFDLVEVEKVGEAVNSPNETLEIIPEVFELYQNHPNPFNPVTTISYNLPVNVKNAIIEIFNIKGEKIKTLNASPNPNLSGGTNSVFWDGIDNHRNEVSAGVYLYRIKSGNFVSKTKKMLMLK